MTGLSVCWTGRLAASRAFRGHEPTRGSGHDVFFQCGSSRGGSGGVIDLTDWVGSGPVGSGRVGSGRVGSGQEHF